MVNIGRLTTKLTRLQQKLQIAQGKGKMKRVARLTGKIAKINAKLSGAGVAAPGAPLRPRGIAEFLFGVKRAPGVPTARKQYQVMLDRGRIVTSTGRILGYTPPKAKKMYKVRRRRKRITQRDRLIIAAIQANPQAAPILSTMM